MTDMNRSKFDVWVVTVEDMLRRACAKFDGDCAGIACDDCPFSHDNAPSAAEAACREILLRHIVNGR